MRRRLWLVLSTTFAILGGTLLLRSQESSSTSQTDKSGLELVSSGPKPIIRVPVAHVHALTECFGYLYFSADEIRYEPVHPAKDREHAFRYLRSELVLSKEYYGAARLEFTNGHNYTFRPYSRLVVPPEHLLQAANQFDSAVTAAQARLAQRAANRNGQSASADSGVEDTEILQEGGDGLALRFGVCGDRSCGYLHFSRGLIRFEAISGRTSDSFTLDRSELANAKEYWAGYWALAELKFHQGKYRFMPFLPEPKIGPSFSLSLPYQNLLDVVTNFDAALGKAETITRYKMPPAPVSMALSSEQKAALETAKSAAEAAEASGQARQAVQQYVQALQGLPNTVSLDIDQDLRQRIIKLVLNLSPPPALPEDARRHAAFAVTALGLAEKDPAQLDSAINEWEQTLRLAPWWAEAYFNSALVLEKARRYTESLRYFKLYLLAAPGATDADTVRQKIYSLEYLIQQKTK